ncbi:uncharacterized protein THITE_2116572 [Thermothielavioides terrestris NRRL 8126]|uniref:Uncharacterized protein n=1 Tax=Thermothielavioides terrestris (strain ATCC 38088 / NRRL 8126) TaxID=578455 RepID=G2R6Q7_THETT|nr:uncharacterized protein THITE_2116572 [Thermothielavioides terrestris NRRL 8126]AEO67689.1 hypothetical protein THITE_2116572 [Thermothielavioides terrestris NRRL 8126]
MDNTGGLQQIQPSPSPGNAPRRGGIPDPDTLNFPSRVQHQLQSSPSPNPVQSHPEQWDGIQW